MQAKIFFNVSVSLSKFWFIDLLRTFDSRTSTNFWKKSFFQVFACLGACDKGTFGCLCLKFVNISESKKFSLYQGLEIRKCSQISWKELFSVLTCLGACEQGSFGSLCSTFFVISESNILNMSLSWNSKMPTDMLEPRKGDITEEFQTWHLMIFPKTRLGTRMSCVRIRDAFNHTPHCEFNALSKFPHTSQG